MEKAHQVLRDTFEFDSFRLEQESVSTRVLAVYLGRVLTD